MEYDHFSPSDISSGPHDDLLPSDTPPGPPQRKTLSPVSDLPPKPKPKPPPITTPLPKPPRMRVTTCPSTLEVESDCLPVIERWVSDRSGCCPPITRAQYDGDPTYTSTKRAFDDELRWGPATGGVSFAEAVALGWSALHRHVKYKLVCNFRAMLGRRGFRRLTITRHQCKIALAEEYAARLAQNAAQKRKKRREKNKKSAKTSKSPAKQVWEPSSQF